MASLRSLCGFPFPPFPLTTDAAGAYPTVFHIRYPPSFSFHMPMYKGCTTLRYPLSLAPVPVSPFSLSPPLPPPFHTHPPPPSCAVFCFSSSFGVFHFFPAPPCLRLLFSTLIFQLFVLCSLLLYVSSTVVRWRISSWSAVRCRFASLSSTSASLSLPCLPPILSLCLCVATIR